MNKRFRKLTDSYKRSRYNGEALISIYEWEMFYCKLGADSRPRLFPQMIAYSHYDPDSDSPILINEILSEIKSNKRVVSSGRDTIGYDFYKYLPLEGVKLLQLFFN